MVDEGLGLWTVFLHSSPNPIALFDSQDLQMQLVDPEEMPAMERLTQEVLMLQEKVSREELQAQEATGNRKLQVW